jgi:hypothetical protein
MRRGEPNSRRFTYYESKRCMRTSVNLDADFSRGCAGKRIGQLLFVTHPYRSSRIGLCQRTMSGDSCRSERLVAASIPCSWQ